MSSLKQPPEYDPSGGDSYIEWKNDLEVWRQFTKEDKKRQGPAVYLCLKGEAREAVRSIEVKDIAKDDGVETIISKLDEIFLKDETTRAFCAFGDFVEYRRGSGESYTKFILEFEKRYREVKKHDLTLNEKVQAYFLLKAANLSDDHERLVRTTATLKYKDMKEQLQKVFGEFNDERNGAGALPIKTEDCFYNESSSNFKTSYFGNRRGRSRGRAGFSGRGRGKTRQPLNSDGGIKLNEKHGNPLDFDGNVMRCHECESTKHFVGDCPHRKIEDAQMVIHITLVAGAGLPEQQALVAETLGKGILDSACTKTVAGTAWMEEFLSLLNDEERDIVGKSSKYSASLFRFGDGKESKSKKTLIIPVTIAGFKMKMEVDVVDAEIPLLISKPTMKHLGMTIDFFNNKASVKGKSIQLKSNSSGHYMIPVIEWADDNCKVVFHLEHLKNLPMNEKRMKAKKIHRQFAHATKEPLLKLLRNGGCDDKEFLDVVKDVCENCEFCLKYRKPKSRPIVSLPKGQRFNDMLCLDLKEIINNKLWILHLIDSTTRYTAACLVEKKKKELVVTKIFQIWIAYFGSPIKMHNDCGGEFCNDVMREMHEKFGIETSTTPGEAPYSNGIVERSNAVIYESMMKTKEDAKCSYEMALAWAVSAKNALQNVHGYSPNQLVLGCNVNLPSVLNSQLPGLNPVCNSDLVRENLNAMHKARENFVKAESSQRIMKALRHKVRTFAEEDFCSGDKVFYQARRGRKGWRGPAKVLGKESNFVLIRHGDAYYRCHPCQLLKAEDAEVTKNSHSEAFTHEEKRKLKSKATPNEVMDDSESDSENKDNYENIEEQEIEEEEYENMDEQETEEGDQNVINNGTITSEIDVSENNTIKNGIGDCDQLEDEREKKETETTDEQGLTKLEQTGRPKINSMVQLMMPDGEIKKGRVLSKQPKQTGRYKDWLNVQFIGENKPRSVDWSKVKWWRKTIQSSQVLFLSTSNEYEQRVIDAKLKELDNLKNNNVFKWVNNNGQKAVSTKWVVTEKINEDGSKRLKARLVARGFEEKLIGQKTDSPTCSRQALRLVFVVASTNSWELHSLDITAAFLQGNEIGRNVFVRPPKEFNENGKLWQLNRCLYGLADAPREWYNRVREVLTDLGGKVSLYDHSLFLWFNERGKLIGILVSHVDDFVYCGVIDWLDNVIDTLVNIFQISKQQHGSFKYLGLNIEQTGSEIFVDQDCYIQELKEVAVDLDRSKLIDERLNDNEKQNLRSVCGQLLWATGQTRPDVSYSSCRAGNSGNSATVRSLLEVNRSVKRLKNENVRLIFPNLGKPENLCVIVYADASHASLPNGGSHGGWLVFVSGNKRVALVEWCSKKLERITKSPIASEASALADAADVGWLTANMLKEIFNLCKLPPITCFSDSKSLKEHLNSTRVIQDPRLRVDTGRLRQMINNQEIIVKWIPGKEQLADCLTKQGASTKKLLDVLVKGAL